MTGTITMQPTGDYSLGAAIRFLEGWPPTAHLDTTATTLSWATHLGYSGNPVAIDVTQRRTGRLDAHYRGDIAEDRVASYAAQVLSIDIDGRGLQAVATRDPVAAALIAANPGLRPVCFWSPYEAAVWGVLSARSSMAQASRLKQRMAEQLGTAIGGQRAFPAPDTLAEIDSFPGSSRLKIERLRSVARAARDGLLNADRLRSMDLGAALASLQEIEGVGPFTAELVLGRGAGHPDIFPGTERRLHALMRTAYDRPGASVAELAEIAAGWRPYRSWIGFLLRSSGT